jgi:glycosyltransferase involved in cell wall biosynthesis
MTNGSKPVRSARVAHLTSVHRLQDVRINLHECRTLADAGYAVTLVGPPSSGPLPAGVRYRTVQPGRGRLRRMTVGVARLFRSARATKASVYHLHDPELLPLAPLLRLGGSRVVYDAHEDLPRQIMSKDWIPRPVRPIIGALTDLMLPASTLAADAVVAATDDVGRTYRWNRVVTVRNYPRVDEFPTPAIRPFRDRPAVVTYVGGVSAARGIDLMVQAVALVRDPEVRLRIAGAPEPDAYGDLLRATPGADRTDLLGWVERPAVAELLNDALAGLVVLPPAPQHAAGMPTKMFEYMAAGLPVIVADYPSWREVVEGAGAGIAVDPLDPSAIAAAIDRIVADRDEAEAMGRRGRAAVLERYNWVTQADALLGLYAQLTGDPIPADRTNGHTHPGAGAHP